MFWKLTLYFFLCFSFALSSLVEYDQIGRNGETLLHLPSLSLEYSVTVNANDSNLNSFTPLIDVISLDNVNTEGNLFILGNDGIQVTGTETVEQVVYHPGRIEIQRSSLGWLNLTFSLETKTIIADVPSFFTRLDFRQLVTPIEGHLILSNQELNQLQMGALSIAFRTPRDGFSFTAPKSLQLLKCSGEFTLAEGGAFGLQSQGIVDFAASVSVPQGTIKLESNNRLIIEDAARFDVSATQATAGTIELRGNQILVCPMAHFKADSLMQNGGTISIVAQDLLYFAGQASASGVHGGHVETSGVARLLISGVAVAAPGGLWLIDPYNVVISNSPDDFGNFSTVSASEVEWVPFGTGSNIQIASILAAFANATGVRVQTIGSPDGAENGDITVQNAIVSSSTFPLELDAAGGITLAASITVGGSLTLKAVDAITAAVTLTADSVTLNCTSAGFALPVVNADTLNVVVQGNINSGTNFNIANELTITTTGNIALGSGTHTLGSGASISIDAGGSATLAVTSASVTLSSVQADGFTFTSSGELTISGDVTVAATTQLTAPNGVTVDAGVIDFGSSLLVTSGNGDISITAPITVGGPVTLNGITSATLTLSAVGNQIDGKITLNGDIFVVANGVTTPFAGPTIEFTNTFQSLTLNFPNANTPVTIGPFTVNSPVTIESLAGDVELNGQITGSATLTLLGSPIFTLSISGDMLPPTIERQNGPLLITGTSNSTFVVSDGATIGGNGTVGDLQVQDGTVAPGFSPGSLTADDVNLTSSSLQIEIAGDTEYDVLTVNSISITDSTLTLTIIPPFVPVGTFVVVHNLGSGLVNGTFTGLPEGPVTGGLGGQDNVSISYVGGGGITLNDITLLIFGVAPTSTTGPTDGTVDDGNTATDTGADGGDGADGDGDGLDTVYIVVISVVGGILLLLLVALIVAGIVVLVIFIIKRKPGGSASGDTWWEEEDNDDL